MIISSYDRFLSGLVADGTLTQGRKTAKLRRWLSDGESVYKCQYLDYVVYECEQDMRCAEENGMDEDAMRDRNIISLINSARMKG